MNETPKDVTRDRNDPINDPIGDVDLMLYYYDDGLSLARRQAITEALARDEALAERYQALSRDLDALPGLLAGDPAQNAAPEGLEYRLKSAISRAARLEAAERVERGGPSRSRAFRPRIVALGTALAVALAVGIGIGLWVAGGDQSAPATIVDATPEESARWSPTAFQRGLESHFRAGRSDLIGLDGEGAHDRASLVASLLQQNRVYAQLAQQNDAPELARVLRSFEPLLQQLGRDDLTDQAAADLQAQLEFEFTVMLTKLSRASSQQTEPNNQEMSL